MVIRDTDILIMEDCVPISVQNDIENNLLSGDFPWYYSDSSSVPDAPYQAKFVENNPLVEDTSQLTHSIFMAFNHLQSDIYLLKVLGVSIYSTILLGFLIPLWYYLIRLHRTVIIKK